jgi:hypothetical protein
MYRGGTSGARLAVPSGDAPGVPVRKKSDNLRSPLTGSTLSVQRGGISGP